MTGSTCAAMARHPASSTGAVPMPASITTVGLPAPLQERRIKRPPTSKRPLIGDSCVTVTAPDAPTATHDNSVAADSARIQASRSGEKM